MPNKNSFIIENLPHTAVRNIISKFILIIENVDNVKELFDLISLSKFFNNFDKEDIKNELYECLKNKKMIEEDIINSILTIEQQIHTFTSGYCQSCYTYNNPKPIYYKNKGYFCRDCFYTKTKKESSLKEFKIYKDDLEDVLFYTKRNKKYYFIEDIEKKIKMPLYDYIAFLNKQNVINTHKNRYYNIKTLKNLTKEKPYDYKFIIENTDFNSFINHCENDFIDFENTVREADVCYEKYINIIEILKNKEYDYEYLKKNILTSTYSLYDMTVERIISKADRKYNSFEDDSDSDFNGENSISNEEEYETDDSEDFIDVD